MSPSEPPEEVHHNDAAYVLGALTPADRQAYEAHLKECAECRASVQRLAGLPGLLSLTRPEDLQGGPPPPPKSLLPRLITVSRVQRRRHRWIVGGVLAATVAALATVVTLWLATGSSSAPPVAAPTPEPMTQVLPGRMTASVALMPRQWGTSILVECQYTDQLDQTVPYDLTVIDTAGAVSHAGAWRGVAGITMRVTTATAVPMDRIASLEVRLPDGRVVLRGNP